MNDIERIAAWEREEQQPFTGWDFLYLNGRVTEEPLDGVRTRHCGALQAAHRHHERRSEGYLESCG